MTDEKYFYGPFLYSNGKLNKISELEFSRYQKNKIILKDNQYVMAVEDYNNKPIIIHLYLEFGEYEFGENDKFKNEEIRFFAEEIEILHKMINSKEYKAALFSEKI